MSDVKKNESSESEHGNAPKWLIMRGPAHMLKLRPFSLFPKNRPAGSVFKADN